MVHNLVISNVPGPQMPLYFMGAKIDALYPLGPIFHGAGLNITVLSNNGIVHVGIIACPEGIPIRNASSTTSGRARETESRAESSPERGPAQAFPTTSATCSICSTDPADTSIVVTPAASHSRTLERT